MMIATRNQVVSGRVESPGHDARQPECVVTSPGPSTSHRRVGALLSGCHEAK
jgi:hypothetical protein